MLGGAKTRQRVHTNLAVVKIVVYTAHMHFEHFQKPYFTTSGPFKIKQLTAQVGASHTC